MILDATAGNRTMWEHKNADNIIYMDYERKLDIPPNIYADNTTTPFPDKTFHAIFYDPPHGWGEDDSDLLGATKITKRTKWLKERRCHAFYGWYRYKTRQSLIKAIYLAQKEFHRILKPDGLLWFKWNEICIPLNRILSAFTDWTELIRIPEELKPGRLGVTQTYWVAMCKKEGKTSQQPLLQFL